MSKTNKTTPKSKKPKLTSEQRSQIAKDRWIKRKAEQDDARAANAGSDLGINEPTPVAPQPPPEQPPVTPESAIPVPNEVAMLGLSAQGLIEKDSKLVEPMKTATPAPQQAPVRVSKQKRTPVPKEFLVALKTADQRLAKAIEEYEDCQQRIVYLSAAIPRLQRTVLALRNESNPDAASSPNAFNPPYNLSGGVPNATAFQNPLPQPYDPLAAIQAAQPTPPISRALGGAIQFGPEVVGEALEGPDDDNPDRFITGPHAGSSGWIGS